MKGLEILVGTAEGLQALESSGAPEFDGHHVGAIAAAGDSLWAAVDKNTIWRRAKGEAKWTIQARLQGLTAECIAGFDGGLLVGTSEAHMLRLKDAKLERMPGFDAVRGRDAWHTPWGGPPDTRSISVAPRGEVFVNVHVGGVISSPDGGKSWIPTGMNIDTDAHQVLAHPKKRGLLFAASAIGLAVSDDSGESWEIESDGMHASYCRAVAIAGDTAIVSASRGPGGGEACLYRMAVGDDGPFEKCTNGLPDWFTGNIDTYCLDAVGSTVSCVTRNGSVYISTDAGGTWDIVDEGLPSANCVLLRRG